MRDDQPREPIGVRTWRFDRFRCECGHDRGQHSTDAMRGHRGPCRVCRCELMRPAAYTPPDEGA